MVVDGGTENADVGGNDSAGADVAPASVSADEVEGLDESDVEENDEGKEDDWGDVEGSKAAPEYSPNFSFRYYNRDGKMDEWAQKFITDKETEDKFRDLYSRSNGFNVLREKNTSLEKEYSGFQEQFQEVSGQLKERSDILEELEYRRDNDLSSFFEYAQVPIEKVIDFVESHLNFLQKPEAEQKQIEAYRVRANQAREAEKQVQQFQSEKQTADYDNHVSSFHEIIEHPEVSDFASRYDEVAGKEGAFQLAVIEHGEAHHLKTGKTLTPLEAVREVYRQYKPFVNGTAQQHTEKLGATREDSPAQRKPVIPNVRGGNTRASTQKVFTSIEDLKAHHKQMVEANGE